MHPSESDLGSRPSRSSNRRGTAQNSYGLHSGGVNLSNVISSNSGWIHGTKSAARNCGARGTTLGMVAAGGFDIARDRSRSSSPVRGSGPARDLSMQAIQSHQLSGERIIGDRDSEGLSISQAAMDAFRGSNNMNNNKGGDMTSRNPEAKNRAAETKHSRGSHVRHEYLSNSAAQGSKTEEDTRNHEEMVQQMVQPFLGIRVFEQAHGFKHHEPSYIYELERMEVSHNDARYLPYYASALATDASAAPETVIMTHAEASVVNHAEHSLDATQLAHAQAATKDIMVKLHEKIIHEAGLKAVDKKSEDGDENVKFGGVGAWEVMPGLPGQKEGPEYSECMV
jgi:hypothetical protein